MTTRSDFLFQLLRYSEDANDGIVPDRSHYLILYALCRIIDPLVAVEIGSRRGGSAMWIAKGLPAGGRLFCVDPFIEAHGGAPAFAWHFDQNLIDLGLRDAVTLLKMTSAQAVDSPHLPPSIDLLFIDGDHSYEGAKHDIQHFVPRVRQGGAVVIHDCLSEPGVSQAIRESPELAPYFHFVVENRQGIWAGVRCQ